MGRLCRNLKSKRQLQEEMERRFDYLPKKERCKLIYSEEFVKVPSRELSRLKVSVYASLM